MAFDLEELRRRGFLALSASVAGGALAGGLIVPASAAPHGKAKRAATKADEKGGEPDVTATEDLMREHGVLRRILIVYAELSNRLRSDQGGKVDPTAVANAAKLFRDFREQYHEKMLEEQHIFPEVRRKGGDMGRLVETLLAQHQRGREITDYVAAVGGRGQLPGDTRPLADTLAGMSRMYQAHSAWEDTVVFPAWKQGQSKARLDDLAEQFEDIEHRTFGTDGFDDALKRIEGIEQSAGITTLAEFTAQPPPKA